MNDKVIPLHRRRPYRYYDLIVVAFVTVLVCSNLIGAGKAAQLDLPFVGVVVFGAGIFFFPISYIFGDILTEVYGYAYDRRAVWCGFAALIFAAIMSQVVIHLPAAPGEYNQQLQEGLVSVFGNTWRIVIASLIAFWAGSLTNAYVLAKLKIMTAGKHLWMRTIGSTLVGELVDSSLFYILAFYAIWPLEQVIKVAIAQYVLKTSWEIVITPITYKVVAFLKRKENEDHYDIDTNFTPFQLKL
jgi:uncharacterized integral membrane protein (TIGR00697 family)